MKKTYLLYAMITGWVLMMSLTGCVTVTTQHPGVATGATPQQTAPVYLAAGPGQHSCQCGHSCGTAPVYYTPYHYGQPQGQYPQSQYPAYPKGTEASTNTGQPGWSANTQNPAQSGSTQSGQIQYRNETPAQTYPTSEPAARPQSQTTTEENTRIVYVPATPPIVQQPEQQTTIQNNNTDRTKDVIDVAIYAIDAIRNASSKDNDEQGSSSTREEQSTKERRPTGGVTGMGGMGGMIRTPNIATNTGQTETTSNGSSTEDCETDVEGTSNQGNSSTRFSTQTTLPARSSSQGGRVVVQSKKQEQSGSVFTGSTGINSTAGAGQGEVQQAQGATTSKPHTIGVSAQNPSAAQQTHVQVTSSSSQPKVQVVKQKELPSSRQGGISGATVTTQKQTVQEEKKPVQVSGTGTSNNNFTVGSGVQSSTTAPVQAAQSATKKPAAVEVMTPASSTSSPGAGMNSTTIPTAPTTVVSQGNTAIQPASNPN